MEITTNSSTTLNEKTTMIDNQDLNIQESKEEIEEENQVKKIFFFNYFF